MKLRKVLFWDTGIENIDFGKHCPTIIERVATYGLLDEWRDVLRYYGMEKVKLVALQRRYWDRKTLNYLSHFFNIPKDAFRCYNDRQSFPAHFPF